MWYVYNKWSALARTKVLYDILGSPQSRDLGHDNLEFQVVVRNLEIDMRLVSPPDGHSENPGARRSQLSCHDSSLHLKRIWWHIMTQGYLQTYKMMRNCVIGNFIVGKKITVAVPVRSVCSSSPAMKCGRVRHELLLKTDSLMKTTVTQVHSHCQKHTLMLRNYHSTVLSLW